MPPSKKRSEVWNHFTIINNGKTAKCSYCYQQISYLNGATANLKRHLDRKHPASSFSRILPTPNTSNNSDHLKNPAELQDPQPEELTGRPKIQVNQEDTPLQQNKKAVQSDVTNFVTVTKPVSVTKSKEIDRQLVRMMVKEYQPFRLVEDKEFRSFVRLLNPGYLLPTRKTISNSLIPQVYKQVTEEVKVKLSAAEAVCLTTDSWTNINNHNFVAVTAHFFSADSSYNLCSVLLSCSEYHERHTAEMLAIFFKDTAREWGIQNHITAVVTDNAPNMVAAVRLCDWRHVGCFAHSLNLVAQAAITKIKNTVTKVKDTVEYFKRSSQSLHKLHVTQDQMSLPRLKLIQDVPTRWNSTYDMLERFYSLKEAIISTVALLQSSKLQPLTSTDWKVIESAKDVLLIFKEVTEEVSMEKNVSLSKVILFVTEITNDILASSQTKDLPQEVTDMIFELQNKMTEKFGNIEDCLLQTQSNLLDPRFKKFSFNNESKYKTACENLKNRAATIEINHEEENTAKDTQEENTNSGPSTKKRRLYDRFDKTVETSSANNKNKLAAGIIEVDKYMKEPLLDRKENPLEWWDKRKHVYPRLYHMAKRRLCIQATSVACERIFSKAGQIQCEKRSRLKSSKLSQILFLNHNT